MITAEKRVPRVQWLGAALSIVWYLLVAALLAGVLWLRFAGWRLEVVDTGSMSPTYPVGAVVAVRPLDTTDVGLISTGDVVLFRHPQATRLVMHRVVDRIEQNGSLFFETQGDANAHPDARLVPASDVDAAAIGRLPAAASLLRHLRPPIGLIWLVAVPWTVSAGWRRLSRRADPVGTAVHADDPESHLTNQESSP